MAPRRNNNLNSSNVVQHYPLQQQQNLLITSTEFSNVLENRQEHLSLEEASSSSLNSSQNEMSPMKTCNSGGNSNGIASSNGHINMLNGVEQQQYTRCCYPIGECLKMDSLIALNDLNECIRVICNNENCNVGQFMHRECFDSWEQSVLNTLKNVGRGRAWSDRQKAQNLWSKKSYEMIYKACGCKCSRGHIRKDIDWPPSNVLSNGGTTTLHFPNGNANNPVTMAQKNQNQNLSLANGNSLINGNNNLEDDEKKKQKKKRNRNNNPSQNSSSTNSSSSTNNQQNKSSIILNPGQQQQQNSFNQNQPQNENLNNLGNPNVGVIGSGLHNNNNSNNDQQKQQQQQQQQNIITLNSLLNGSNNTFNNNNNNTNGNTNNGSANGILDLGLRARAGSFSSSGAGSSGSTSPSASQTSSIDVSISPLQQQQQQQQNFQQMHQFQNSLMLSSIQQPNDLPLQQQLQLNGLSKHGLSNGFSNNNLLVAKQSSQVQPPAPQPQQQQQHQPQNLQVINNNIFQQLNNYDQQQLRVQQKNKEVEIYSERVRSTSGCNGIFSRRLDFSSFNLLPKTRLNSYQVKIEDEGNHGNDETRLFILSSLAQSQMSRVACILCEEPMLVFDRYPLVDGSFFLSPKQHSPGCIEVKYEGRTLFLTAVCMSCLDGTCSNRIISCRFCGEVWDGSNLVLGTMYAYDIFAAMPCCSERLKCNNCYKLLLLPQKLLNFYSDYSHCVTCPYCATQDTHFVKPLRHCYTKNNTGRLQQIA